MASSKDFGAVCPMVKRSVLRDGKQTILKCLHPVRHIWRGSPLVLDFFRRSIGRRGYFDKSPYIVKDEDREGRSVMVRAEVRVEDSDQPATQCLVIEGDVSPKGDKENILGKAEEGFVLLKAPVTALTPL